ncbi:hypothetical protein KXJ74_08060 [Acinetobacter johnsonii]|jgi:hypothetical protein|nr:hypothetical protein KXJ74_08060 [Acinetobacter johnsonii]
MSVIPKVTLINIVTIMVEVSFETFQLLGGLLASAYNDLGFSWKLLRVFLFEHLKLATIFFVKLFCKKIKDALLNVFMNAFKAKAYMYLIS